MAEQQLGLDTTRDPASDPLTPSAESFDDLAEDSLVEDVSIDGMCGVY